MNEELGIIEFLRTGKATETFRDDLHRRVVSAFEDPQGSDLDRAVLVRQILRRWSLRDGRDVPVELSEMFSNSIREAASSVGILNADGKFWSAREWSPEWLQSQCVPPDSAALAGTEAGVRFRPDPLRSDPFFRSITTFPTYRTPGQRAACRAVMTTPEGSTVIAMLPTGSGKTEVALCLAERSKFGLTLIVVPTVALAYDFERRFREHFARKNPRVNPDALNFAWTAATDEAMREKLRYAIVQGQQPLLVTSPESMTRALRQTLIDAASIGRLQGIVVDEAHLVTQWGRSFRPEFRSLADLRRDLLRRAEDAGFPRAVTLLLSATLGDFEMKDLSSLFGNPGPCSLVVANALRSEPDLFIATSRDTPERECRVLETLAHCARPAVLYVTRPDKAESWLATLRSAGYSRVVSVTGETLAGQRAAVLDGLRMNSANAKVFDLVVATSAFGLGIDYPHVRTVIHACLPETVDRWYQELGRGGRDGDASAAFLLTAPGDESEAADLGVRVLSPEIAKKRWNDLWSHRKDMDGRSFVDLEGARGSVNRGDYNRRWNAQLVQGLIELGELQREPFDLDDIRELPQPTQAETTDWVAVSKVSARMGHPGFWKEVWEPWQLAEMKKSSASLRTMSEVASLSLGACTGVAAAYAPSDALKADWGDQVRFMEPVDACGRCPECRRLGVTAYLGQAPEPVQNWAVAGSGYEELMAFVVAAKGANGVAFLTYKHGEERLATRIATGLVKLGVRHVAGLELDPAIAAQGTQFSDERPLSPLDLTPVPSFSYFAVGADVSSRWLARREIPRRQFGGLALADVLLAPHGTPVGPRRLGADLPALTAATALELLPRS